MKFRILVIDDSPTMRGLVTAALEPAGFEIHQAQDGVNGLDRLAAADPHLVITDINMPRLDGFGVIQGIRTGATNASVPILVLTTEAGGDLKDRARRSGATGWIVKPFDEARLISTINLVLGV
ncbi:two-component system response regulator [Rhodobacteraceae bacterium EhC02]|nr:two-component system response regulator [Rhodobacteraceae bacterium EhC02]